MSDESHLRLASIADRIEVAPGVMMPRLGLGTWKAHGDALKSAIVYALEIGYRLLDTSPVYFNEREVGRAIARSGVPREELFVTTKLDPPGLAMGTARGGLDGSLRRLGLEYVDLYIAHFPVRGVIERTWRALEDVQREGLTRSIGVSNYEVSDLERVLAKASVVPAVNQVELNPLMQRRDLQEFCSSHGIVLEAWAPVLQGSARRVPTLTLIGQQHDKTPEQISLRWILQKGIIAIPKTVHLEWVRKNAGLYDIELTPEEMAEIDAI